MNTESEGVKFSWRGVLQTLEQAPLHTWNIFITSPSADREQLTLHFSCHIVHHMCATLAHIFLKFSVHPFHYRFWKRFVSIRSVRSENLVNEIWWKGFSVKFTRLCYFVHHFVHHTAVQDYFVHTAIWITLRRGYIGLLIGWFEVLSVFKYCRSNTLFYQSLLLLPVVWENW